MLEKENLSEFDLIDYDGSQGQVTIHFHPSGLESLLTETTTEVAA